MAAPLTRDRAMASLLRVAVLVAASAVPVVAAAQPEAPPEQRSGPGAESSVASRLAVGEAQFADLDYADAAATLAPVADDPRATRAQRLRALEIVALSHLTLGDEDRAADAFERLLAIDPDHQLRDDSGSPKIRAFFEAARRRAAASADATRPALLAHVAPGPAVAGQRVALEFDVPDRDAAAVIKEVVVHWRRRGERGYRAQQARQVEPGRWRATLRVPTRSAAYALEYHVEARDIGGRLLGRLADPEAPLSLAVTPGSASTASPWYGRWYVWAGTAAVVGGTLAVFALSGDDGPSGTLEPGTVVLTPR